MSTTKPASEWTQDEINSYLSELNNTHFQERLLLFILVYSSCITGVLGNTLTFVIYLKHFPHNSTRMFVLALSVTDFTTTSIGSPLSSMITVYFYSFYSDAACKMFYTIARVLLSLSVLLLGLIAFDRYRHVCRPQSKQFSPHVALLQILVACALSLGTSLPLIPIYNLMSIPTNVTGINGSHCMLTFQTINAHYGTLFTVFNGITFVGSLVLMIFCYGNIGIRLCKLRLSREKQSTLSTQGPIPFLTPSLRNGLQNFPQTIIWETSFPIMNPIEESKIVEVGDSSADSSSTSGDIKFKKISQIQKSFNHLTVINDKNSGITDTSEESSVDIFEIPKKLPQTVKSPVHISVNDTEEEKEISSVPSSVFETEDEKELSPIQVSVFNTQVEQESAKKINKSQGIDTNTSLNQNSLEAAIDVADAANDEPSKATLRTSSSESSESTNAVDKQEPSFFKRVCPTVSCKLCRRGTKQSRYGRTATTMMMFVLTVLFVVLFLPFLIVSSITPPHKIPCQGLPIVELNFCEMAIYYFPVLNSVVNPFVYSMFSYRFRQECKRYLCWFRKS